MAKVRWDDRASADLLEIYDWIEHAADPVTALNYVEAIRTFADTLCDFPERGTPRSASGIRTINFKRRAVVTYRYADGVVVIIGIYHAGREVDLD